MENPKFLPAISVALYQRALDAARCGQTCNVVMLCCASMEAFINEYTKLGITLINDDAEKRDLAEKNKKINGLTGKTSIVCNAFYIEEKNLILELDRIEREDIFSKINTIKKYCIGEEWDRDSIAYYDYRTLIKIRNALVHPCSEMEVLGKFHIPKFLKPFYQQKKIKYFNDLNTGDSWIEAIDTVKFSNWCLVAFQRMMILVINDMYNIKLETSPNLPPITYIRSLKHLQFFHFPESLLKSVLKNNQ
ncbi:hypothetical protein [Acinetobacter soli]|uniref:hypothetical protein n=1 Tax=Acinetobacter soli TaxID=487316 RepID=UPI00124FE05F|nr:hypothetical protein [Acinetobacter soli]